MNTLTLSRGRSVFDLLWLLFRPMSGASSRKMPVDVGRLVERLLAAQELATPSFMSLSTVRKGGSIVDFVWDSASPAAARLLSHDAAGLRGKRLLDVLDSRSGRAAAFNQYRHVVEYGGAKVLRQVYEVNRSLDVFRQGAVRHGDGVAVTLTNLSALRREKALRSEIDARSTMPPLKMRA